MSSARLCEFLILIGFHCASTILADVINAAKAAKLDINQKLIYCSVRTFSRLWHISMLIIHLQSMGADSQSYFLCKL